ncbi:hypothetical protein MMC25_001267 [Agyrium rufum]|nr:hypothetical protein [Agyrium rufum]
MSPHLLDCLRFSVSSLFMARQLKRRFEENPSSSEQDNPRVKRTKTGDQPRQQHHEVRTYPLSPQPFSQDSPSVEDNCPVEKVKSNHLQGAGQSSPDQTLCAALISPSSVSLFEDSHLANVHQTIAVTLSDTVTPLTRQSLEQLDMSSSRSRTSRRSKAATDSSSQVSRRTKATTVNSTKSDRINAYSNSFPQILEDGGIYLSSGLTMVADREELQRARSVRPSLSPSEFSDGEIEYFIEPNANAATEPDIERDVVPAIVGRHRLPHSGNVSWANMSSMTDGLTVAPQPDLYYGVRVRDIPKPIRDRIGHLIVPSTVPNAPASPHFVLENKGLSGSLEMVKRQAAHSAAAVARAAFALENFVVDIPIYHNKSLANAWTYTSSSGDLTQYAMRVSPPKTDSSQPGYHLTHVKTHHITESKEQFRKGVSALRHCRDDSHVRNQARFAKGHEYVQRLHEQINHCDTTSDPAQDEIYTATPLPEAHLEDVNDGDATSRFPSGTLPRRIPDVGRPMTTHEFNA